MSATRTVREDQHGTNTGYTYGCRCDECREAAREYRREHGSSVGPEAVERVMAALEHEADMDGLVTASGDRLGELADISRAAVGLAIHELAEQGRASVVGRSAGRGRVLVVQIGDQ